MHVARGAPAAPPRRPLGRGSAAALVGSVDDLPVHDGEHHRQFGSSSGSHSTGSSANTVRSAAKPARIRPSLVLVADRHGRGRRVARERGEGVDRLVVVRRAVPLAGRTAQRAPPRGRAGIEACDRPVGAERDRPRPDSRSERIGNARRSQRSGAEPPRPVVGAVGLEPDHVLRLHRGDHALGGEARQVLGLERLDVLDAVADTPAPRRPRGRRRAPRARRGRPSRASRTGSRRARTSRRRGDSAPDRARTARARRPRGRARTSQPVPESITPSMKNFATPARQRRPPRRGAEAAPPSRPRCDSGLIVNGMTKRWTRSPLPSSSRSRSSVSSVAVHPVRAGQPRRRMRAQRRSVQRVALGVAWARGIARSTVAIAAHSRSSPVGAPSRHTISACSVKLAGPRRPRARARAASRPRCGSP